MTVNLWTGVIPADAVDIVEARVDRLHRRALRVGFPAPRAVHGDRTFRMNENGTSTLWVNLAIEADGPLRVGDWDFVGTVSELGDGSPFVTFAPGVERTNFLPAQVNWCDHCCTFRQRKDTYLIRSESEGIKQVGSTCIKDFTGHDPAVIVGWLRAVEDLSFSDDEIEGWGRSATTFYSVSRIIGLAARIVTKTGYISKQKAEEDFKASTAETLRAWLSAASPYRIAEYEDAFPADEASDKLFADTMAAIPAATGNSEWVQDIVRLAAAGSVQWRHVGILGSAVILGMRKVEREATEGRPASHFIGSIGQRLEFTDVTVNMKRGYESAYGQSYVIRMTVNGSDDLLWFGSGEAAEALNEGDVITIVGTVKNHEVDARSHRETTVLTRCKVKGN